MKPGVKMGVAMTILMTGVAFSATTASAGELSAAMLSNTCDGCHGPDGTSAGPAAPTIGGTNKEYMLETMIAFREGLRPSTIMQRIAKGYSDEELELIAGHFASKPFGRTAEQETDPALVAKGKEIYDNLCEDCHEDNGRAAEDYAALAGQMMPYLGYEMADLISGTRDIDKNEALSSKERRKKKRNLEELVNSYGDEGIQALIHFFGSQK